MTTNFREQLNQELTQPYWIYLVEFKKPKNIIYCAIV